MPESPCHRIPVAAFALTLTLAFLTACRPGGGEIHVDVRVVAKKFSWHFHYSGEDGMYGRVTPELISASNPLGLEADDPAAADDVHSTTLVLPIDCRIRLRMTSSDVIHTLGELPGAPGLDGVPGVLTSGDFKSPGGPKAGTMKCTTLCGVDHAKHTAPYEFVEWNRYQSWLSSQPKALPAAAGAPTR